MKKCVKTLPNLVFFHSRFYPKIWKASRKKKRILGTTLPTEIVIKAIIWPQWWVLISCKILHAYSIRVLWSLCPQLGRATRKGYDCRQAVSCPGLGPDHARHPPPTRSQGGAQPPWREGPGLAPRWSWPRPSEPGGGAKGGWEKSLSRFSEPEMERLAPPNLTWGKVEKKASTCCSCKIANQLSEVSSTG